MNPDNFYGLSGLRSLLIEGTRYKGRAIPILTLDFSPLQPNLAVSKTHVPTLGTEVMVVKSE